MTDTVHDSMNTILKEENVIKQIREAEFKQHILPILTDHENQRSVQPWVELSGSWTRDIEVVDDHDHTRILFKLPSLVARTKEPVLQKKGQSAYDIVQDVQRKMGTLPQVANEMLKNRLRDRIVPDTAVDEIARNWEIIYKRYGIAGAVGDTDTGNGNAPITREHVLGYDD